MMNLLTLNDYSQVVNIENLECELEHVRAAAAGSLSGVFGPGSVTWQIDREGAIFLGAGRALLLQLAHPWVAAAVEQHSDAFADPVGRFHRTFSTVFSMVFGTLNQSMSEARRLHRRHAGIKGQLPWAAGPFPAGSFYCANAIPALRWVYATLVETALVAYEVVLPPLTPQQRERFYRESLLFADRVVPAAEGRVLEIGVGPGLNFQFYSSNARQVIGLDPSPKLLAMARRASRSNARPMQFIEGSAEKIALEDASADTIVTTWTLCSVPAVLDALDEMRGVLKPTGRLLFVEHGQAPDANVRRWQDRLTPLWKRIGGGCHLNRAIHALIEGAGFQFDRLETGYMRGPKMLTFMYEGSAHRR